MTKQTFKIYIAGTDYSSYISYPVSITEKNLDESLNIMTLSLKHMVNSIPFKPNRKVEFRVYIDDVLTKIYYFLLLNDITEKIGVTSYYNHKLTLIEFTQVLENTILPDMTITRIENIYEPTLYDVVNKILLVAELNTSYTINSTTKNILDAIESPEWTFTRMTALEALRLVFSMAKIVPMMKNFTQLGHIGLLDTSETTKMNSFVASQEAYDPQTFKTALYSNVENFIAGVDTIIEPANGWITPRSPDGFEIGADNIMIPTSRPIYKIEDLRLRQWIWVTNNNWNGSARYTMVPESAIPQEWFKSLNEFLYEKGVWDTLENIEKVGERGGTIYYEQGKPNIQGLTYRVPTRWSWNPKKQSWRLLAIDYLRGTPMGEVEDWRFTNLSTLIKPEYVALAEAAAQAAWVAEHGQPNGSAVYRYKSTPTDQGLSSSFVLPYSLQFRITYTPYITTNIFTFRERYDNEDEVKSFQTYNQTANVIGSEVLADLHDKVIKRGSGSGIDYTFLHKNWTDLPTIGKRFGDYIITSADYTINQYGIQSTYNIDKYYQKLQKYVAVLEKWRQFSIPNEGIVRRQITINNFVKFSVSPSTNSSGINPSKYKNVGEEVRLMYFNATTSTGSNAFIVPATSFVFNNALIFEGIATGNANAGNKSAQLEIYNDQGEIEDYSTEKRRDEPYIYTDENGYVELLTIALENGYNPAHITLANSYSMPDFSYVDGATQCFYLNGIEVEKDAREILSASIQLHHIDTTGKIYINSGWAKRNGMIGGVGINTGVRMAYLDFKPFNTTDATGHIMNSGSATHLYNSANGGYYIIPIRTNSSGTAAQSWAMIDGTTNEILYWCDETVASAATNTQYVINFSDTY